MEVEIGFVSPGFKWVDCAANNFYALEDRIFNGLLDLFYFESNFLIYFWRSFCETFVCPEWWERTESSYIS